MINLKGQIYEHSLCTRSYFHWIRDWQSGLPVPDLV
jgi:hypothetical protein